MRLKSNCGERELRKFIKLLKSKADKRTTMNDDGFTRVFKFQLGCSV